ncbi:FecR domain-containing protein [Thermodesulfobacteriota bacterium]
MKRALFAVASALFLLAFVAPARAQSVGTFTYVEGTVLVTSGGQEPRSVNTGDVVSLGDVIRTETDSKAEVTFQDGNILRFAENSEVSVNRYALGQERTDSLIQLYQGKVQNLVRSFFGTDPKYEIHTPTAVCGVRGTNLFVTYLMGISSFIFKEGAGYGYPVNAPEKIQNIAAGIAMILSSATADPILREALEAELLELMRELGPHDGGWTDTGAGGDMGDAGSGVWGANLVLTLNVDTFFNGVGLGSLLGGTGTGGTGVTGGTGTGGEGGVYVPPSYVAPGVDVVQPLPQPPSHPPTD